jgi:hypothetical protein
VLLKADAGMYQPRGNEPTLSKGLRVQNFLFREGVEYPPKPEVFEHH